MADIAERFVLASRPTGLPTPDNWRLESFAIPRPGDGEILLRTPCLSLDPYMRARMLDGPSYAAPIPIGGVMEGDAVAEVVASNHTGFAAGDVVFGRTGWQT